MTSWSYEIRVYFCTKVRVTSIGPWQHGAHSIAKLTVIFNLIQDICLANFNECIVLFSKESFNPIKVFAWQAFFSRLKIDIGSSKNYLLQRRWRNVLVVNIDKIYAQTYVQNWWYQYCCCFPSEERNYSKNVKMCKQPHNNWTPTDNYTTARCGKPVLRAQHLALDLSTTFKAAKAKANIWLKGSRKSMKRWHSIIFPINGRPHFSYNCSSRDLTCDCEMVFFHILEKSLGIRKETKDTYTGISLGKTHICRKKL